MLNLPEGTKSSCSVFPLPFGGVELFLPFFLGGVWLFYFLVKTQKQSRCDVDVPYLMLLKELKEGKIRSAQGENYAKETTR